ncbi:MAG TPA: hypothetical protein VI564_03000 [Candidatus Nanoarchaeia archaeon]|nr:hypothetical protein [Candidatus Nanoarchaeia archaeon]
MIGQFRKCVFCKKKFRLTSDDGSLFRPYNFVVLISKVDGGYSYAHKTCHDIFLRARNRDAVTEFKAGFDVKSGPFLYGKLKFNQ